MNRLIKFSLKEHLHDIDLGQVCSDVQRSLGPLTINSVEQHTLNIKSVLPTVAVLGSWYLIDGVGVTSC